VAHYMLVSRNLDSLHELRTSLREANILIYARISKSHEHDAGMLVATLRCPGEGYSQLLHRLRFGPKESGLISDKGMRYIHFAIASRLALEPTRPPGYRGIFPGHGAESSSPYSDEFKKAWSSTPTPTPSQCDAYLITYINICTHPHLLHDAVICTSLSAFVT
jgi:hypothetical protein